MEDYKKKYEEVLKRIKECVPDDNGFITIYLKKSSLNFVNLRMRG